MNGELLHFSSKLSTKHEYGSVVSESAHSIIDMLGSSCDKKYSIRIYVRDFRVILSVLCNDHPDMYMGDCVIHATSTRAGRNKQGWIYEARIEDNKNMFRETEVMALVQTIAKTITDKIDGKYHQPNMI